MVHLVQLYNVHLMNGWGQNIFLKIGNCQRTQEPQGQFREIMDLKYTDV